MKNLDQLISEVEKIARKNYDGHFTILSFTTHYKGCFGTITLDSDYRSPYCGRKEIRLLPPFKTLNELLQWMIDEQVDSYTLTEIAEQTLID